MIFAVDFDGTLAEYDGWKGIRHTGKPIPAMVNRVRRWLAEGHAVYIFTSRLMCSPDFGATEQDRPLARKVVGDWCERHIGKRLYVTHEKEKFDQLWDDKVVQVVQNKGVALHEYFEDMLWDMHHKAIQSRNHAMMGEAHAAIQKLRALDGETV